MVSILFFGLLLLACVFLCFVCCSKAKEMQVRLTADTKGCSGGHLSKRSSWGQLYSTIAADRS